MDGLFNSNSLNGKSDSLSEMNFDGDWVATNNWDNLATHSIQPTLYYYVAATSTHYFITYGYFHPRDWTQLSFFHFAQHENDLEGIMLVIEKNDSKWGELLLGYSIFHLSIKRNIYPEAIHSLQTSSRRFKQGVIESEHPVSYQQPRGHGIKLDPTFFKPKLRYCRYIPENNLSTTSQDQTYRLVNLLDKNELIDQVKNEDLFNADGTIKGSHGEGANPPWLWKDYKDKKAHPDLQLFVDPAQYVLIDCLFSGPYSTDYIYHPFLQKR
jgi:hypothetical protein